MWLCMRGADLMTHRMLKVVLAAPYNFKNVLLLFAYVNSRNVLSKLNDCILQKLLLHFHCFHHFIASTVAEAHNCVCKLLINVLLFTTVLQISFSEIFMKITPPPPAA